MGFSPLVEHAPKVEPKQPMPPSKRGHSFGRRLYPWLEMQVGDSFLVQKAQHRFGNAVWNAQQRYGLKFSTRSVMVNGVKCTRVWRIA